jgi:phage virion morphogenesis family|nr:MAG TPA: tail morphogenesis protein [Caudoviricetes sp.]
MNIKELNKYLQSLSQEITEDAADIVAETATAYYKGTFRRKEFDGNPWALAKVPKTTGSLLIDSGALVNSIRPAVVTSQKVVISAGNNKVDYAQVHNEGFSGTVGVPAHTRKTKRKDVQVKAHTRKANIIKREFMGDSNELNEQIHARIQGYIDSLNK